MSVVLVVATAYAVFAGVVFVLVWALCRAAALADRRQELDDHGAAAVAAGPAERVSAPAAPRRSAEVASTAMARMSSPQWRARRVASSQLPAVADALGPVRSHPQA